MTRASIDFLFYLTLFGGFPLGIGLMIIWAKKIFPALMKRINQDRHIAVSTIATRSLFYMIPGLVLLILCCIPMLYFGNLRKQREYCLQVVRVNKGITKESTFLLKRCGEYDLDELFRDAGVTEGE